MEKLMNINDKNLNSMANYLDTAIDRLNILRDELNSSYAICEGCGITNKDVELRKIGDLTELLCTTCRDIEIENRLDAIDEMQTLLELDWNNIRIKLK